MIWKVFLIKPQLLSGVASPLPYPTQFSIVIQNYMLEMSLPSFLFHLVHPCSRITLSVNLPICVLSILYTTSPLPSLWHSSIVYLNILLSSQCWFTFWLLRKCRGFLNTDWLLSWYPQHLALCLLPYDQYLINWLRAISQYFSSPVNTPEKERSGFFQSKQCFPTLWILYCVHMFML